MGPISPTAMRLVSWGFSFNLDPKVKTRSKDVANPQWMSSVHEKKTFYKPLRFD